MTTIKGFQGYRLNKDAVSNVAAPPYDVVSKKEAADFVTEKPHNMLHVTRPEIDCPDDTPFNAKIVYETGQENLAKLLASNAFQKDSEEGFAIYQMKTDKLTQTGLVALVSTHDYDNNLVKKHETTRPNKEQDRVRHLQAHNGQVSPVLLCYEPDETITSLLNQWLTKVPEPTVSTTYQGTTHSVWHVFDKAWCDEMTTAFSALDHIYVADGHHRTASASLVAQSDPSNPSKAWMLSVVFESKCLDIQGYHRVFKELNNLNLEQFLGTLSKTYEITEGYYVPASPFEYSLYCDGKWYLLSHHEKDSIDSINTLPVTVLRETIVEPILSITDQRNSPNIDFIGGRDAIDKIVALVDSGEMAAGLILCPTSMEQLIACANRAEDVPPKSTWFEPKLLDGFFMYFYE